MLAPQTALITGANQGIGWAIASLFVQHGARVALTYPKDNSYPTQLDSLGGSAVAFRSDASRVGDIRSLFENVRTTVDGRLDILVDNAGIFPRNDVLDMDEQTWDTVLDTNLKGTFFACQEATRTMIARGSGCLINISSGGAFTVLPNAAHYGASKAGVLAVTKGFARALASHGVR
jgi:3-oxoacyl-[acyl-carrier protein] reductase